MLRKTFKVVILGMGLMAIVTAVETVPAGIPDCPTRYCDESFAVVRLGTNIEDFAPIYDIPIRELYGVCAEDTCCNSYQCSVQVPEGEVDAGMYSCDVGALTLSLPIGFAVSGSSNLTLNGDPTVSVPASMVSYTIGNCSKIGLEIGAVYQNTMRSFDARLICSEDGEECEEIDFTGWESVTTLVVVPGSLGDNGHPFSGGCGGQNPNPCADPANNTCPN